MGARELGHIKSGDFIGKIASYVLNLAKSDQQIAGFTILLPNLRDVVSLQDYIVRERNFTLLPNILSFESSFRDDLALAPAASEVLTLANCLSRSRPEDSYLDLIDDAKSLRSKSLSSIHCLEVGAEIDALNDLKNILAKHHLVCSIDSKKTFACNLADKANLILAGFSQDEITQNKIIKDLIKRAGSNCTIVNIESSLDLSPKIKGVDAPQIFKDRYDEAKYISSKIKHLPFGNIAVASGSASVRQFYRDYLRSRRPAQNNVSNLALAPAGALAVALCKFLYNEFSAANLMTVLNHPLLAQEHGYRLDILLRSKYRFVNSFDDLMKCASSQSEEFQSWLKGIVEILRINIAKKTDNPALVIKRVMSCLRRLVFDARENQDFDELENFYAQLYTVNFLPQITELNQIHILMHKLQEMKQTKSIRANEELQIISLHEARLQKFDIIFIPSISAAMPDDANGDIEINNLYHMLYQNRVLICDNHMARASASILSAKILYMLQNDLRLDFQEQGAGCDLEVESQKDTPKTVNLEPDFFPRSISASSVELLSRAPYHFYCKKILKLQKLFSVEAPPSPVDFGSLLHKVFELYTTKTSKKNSGIGYFKSIARGLLNQMKLPVEYTAQWQSKLDAIAADFVEFDHGRKEISNKISTEITGSIDLQIGARNIKLTGIADRIEQRRDGSTFICDYKTGATPAKSDILSGLSPQLIVLAIIMFGGGFEGVASSAGSINLEYIKIQSSVPYIAVKDYAFTQDQITRHKEALSALLHHYIEKGEFDKEVNLTAYREYFGM